MTQREQIEQTISSAIDIFIAEVTNYIANSANSVVVGGTVELIPITTAEKALLKTDCQDLDDLDFLSTDQIVKLVALAVALT